MIPEKMTDSGLGATACASDSQKCRGTIAPLISRAPAIRQNAAATKGESGRQIQQPDTAQQHVAADPVGHGESKGSFKRGRVQVISGQRKGRDTHHLEPHEQIEQIVGEHEPDYRRHEYQHHCVVPRAGCFEKTPGEDEIQRHEQCRENREHRARLIHHEGDPDHLAVPRRPAAKPIGEWSVRGRGQQQHTEDASENRGRNSDDVGHAARQ